MSMPNETEIDAAAIERLQRFGGGKLLREMIALFIEHAPTRVQAARAGMDAGDADAVRMALHSLKSSAAQLGAMTLQDACARGEELARAGSLTELPAVVAEVEQESPRVLARLDAIRQESAAS
ncbi:MAG: hypothetical protein JWO05_870 [Gemmatimonadetes bacterium]|nr:hypothetical protein [Gemmatimonadota bacterium]